MVPTNTPTNPWHVGVAKAVTQLFTEPYMVKFLLHNTLGAWWAGKVLAARPDLAREAADEDELRAACALPGVAWEYLRFVRDPAAAPSPTQPLRAGSPLSRNAGEGQDDGPDLPLSRTAGEGGSGRSPETGEGARPWRPAAGAFPGWPTRAVEITYLDPCCGSGHFLVEAFTLLAALRRAEEDLPPVEAARAVLRDNLHGLEIDGCCVQIAAFNVALAAWRLAGGPVPLPVPHIAWVGAPPPLPKAEFMALANGDEELQRGLAALHDLFRQAPLLGTLIELTGGDLLDPTRVARLDQSIAALVEKMRGAEPEPAEGVLAARGMADAAGTLARRFTLQATNVPFLGWGRQTSQLQALVDGRFPVGSTDLATVVLLRMCRFADVGGAIASVTPQNWFFLNGFKELRRHLLRSSQFALMAGVGSGAFETISGAVVNAALVVLENAAAVSETQFAAIDANDSVEPSAKAATLKSGAFNQIHQITLLDNDTSIIRLHPRGMAGIVSDRAIVRGGITSGDSPLFRRFFWEPKLPGERWSLEHVSFSGTKPDNGLSNTLLWEQGRGLIARRVGGNGATVAGREAWGREGIAISYVGGMSFTRYHGTIYENTICVLVPQSADDLAAFWCFCKSGEFVKAVKKVNRKLSVDVRYFEKADFNVQHWIAEADREYPNGPPEPYSDDPTQWLFHGHPRYAEAGTELHVALARLAGYRWPAESDGEMRLSAEARARIAEAATLPEADADGLLPLEAELGKRPLADRLRTWCAAAWGAEWRAASEARLVAAACERFNNPVPRQPTFEAWLRGPAARQHAKLFHDRPFLWWIGDGRADGFAAVAHYHRFGRAGLERLTWSMLNDWLERLGPDDPRADAAKLLQHKLSLILEGEAPYDIFVRWKKLARQPVGWDPDLDDGVRLNIRPFIEADILTHAPNVNYRTDRGADVPSAPWYDAFQGKRRNDHHTTLAEKRAARVDAAE